MRNNLGGHWNHTYFWDLMTPGGAKAPTGDLQSAINGAFGDFDKMKAAVKQAALTRFGSGWAWLAVGRDKKLAVFNTPYQDTPHMDMGAKAIVGIDVWEHAYYLKHQYRRGDYVDAWWNVVNWDKAAANFKAAGVAGCVGPDKKKPWRVPPGPFPAAGWGIRWAARKVRLGTFPA